MQRYIINLSSGKALNPLHPGADSLPCHLPVGAAIRTWLGLLLRHTIHHPHGWFSAPGQIGVTVSGAFYKEIPWGKGPAREVCLQITLVLTLLLSVVTQQTQESMQPFLLRGHGCFWHALNQGWVLYRGHDAKFIQILLFLKFTCFLLSILCIII